MICHINAFKKMNLLFGRSSCKESIDWILSLYDSDSIDLNELFQLTIDSESTEIPRQWRLDAKRYVQSYLALKEVCKYNNVEIVKSPRYKVTIGDNITELKTLNGSLNKKTNALNSMVTEYLKNVTYTTNKNGLIEKIDKNKVDLLDSDVSIVLVDSKNNLFRAVNKYKINDAMDQMKLYAENLIGSSILIEQHLTDPTGLFDVWVKVDKE